MQVKASIITAEAGEVQKEIVNLVNLHTIRKLVVGAIPEYVSLSPCVHRSCVDVLKSFLELSSYS